MQKLVTFLIFVLIVVLIALVTIPQWAVKKPDKVLIGHFPDVPNCWFYFGLDQGLFEKYKLEPKLLEFSSYAEALDSLRNGTIDCFFSFPWSFLLQEMADTLTGIDEDTIHLQKAIMSFYSTPEQPYGALLVPEKSKITAVKKLSRKKIGVLTGPYAELEVLLNTALQEEISEKNVRTESVEKSELSSLLEDKEIAGVLLYEPNLVRMLQRGQTQVLKEDPISSYLINPYPLQVACMSTSFLTEKGEAALNFRNALEELLQLGSLNEADVRTSLTDYMNLTTSESRKVRLPLFETYETIDREAIQNFADLLTGEGVLPGTLETQGQGIFFDMFE
jgi:ABC-type nitrate/sulfonate/bicarbonate transport system substrate-binding protein